jgi:CRISPR/Cas system endoribonuclease Cas6 (RAMP superfamily)
MTNESHYTAVANPKRKRGSFVPNPDRVSIAKSRLKRYLEAEVLVDPMSIKWIDISYNWEDLDREIESILADRRVKRKLSAHG